MSEETQSRRKDEIAAVAAKLIKQQGHLKFSLNELGKLCGVPAGTLYRSFNSKSDLLVYIFTQVVRTQSALLSHLSQLPISAKEKMICFACFPYYYRSVNHDLLGLTFSGANNVLMRDADEQLQTELRAVFALMFSQRGAWFHSFLEQNLIASPQPLLRTIQKRLTLLSRGGAIMGGHAYIPEDEYNLNDMIEFAAEILAPLEWGPGQEKMEHHQIVVALRTISDAYGGHESL
ncbi:TetR/AcrR family transcriptional regulator [Ferrimonas kyonanensis]|uniref:TetR/AcrR family transcriptional regulator n=1 Tax=Ferrimonas kyonanensis TaxID=364763 RepID=UPI0003F84105|nr:helix-turn-helix domain-containing protein [Ferrimonas kyonanensis]